MDKVLAGFAASVSGAAISFTVKKKSLASWQNCVRNRCISKLRKYHFRNTESGTFFRDNSEVVYVGKEKTLDVFYADPYYQFHNILFTRISVCLSLGL